MSTLSEIETSLRQQYPTLQLNEGGGQRNLTATEYDAKIAEWAKNQLASEAQGVIDTTEKAERDKMKTRYAALKAGTATAAQVQEVVAWLLRQQVREIAP